MIKIKNWTGITPKKSIAVLLLALLIAGFGLGLMGNQAGQGFMLWPFGLGRHQTAPRFEEGDQVLLEKTTLEERSDLEPLKQEVGRLVSSQLVEVAEGKKWVYGVQFASQTMVEDLTDQDLRAVEPPFALGQTTALVQPSHPDGEEELGRVERVRVLDAEASDLEYQYTVVFPQQGLLEGLRHGDLIWIHDLALSVDGTAADNLNRLREAMDRGRTYTAARLNFPSGDFWIGSPEPQEDYLELFSNLEFRGQDTTLLVEDTLVFAGLATGPGGKDGVRHFTMQGLNFQATNLETGNFVAVVANHGSDWKIMNNRFGLVHAMSTHVFDLGGLQDSLFEHNTFEGYAPNLTKERKLGDWTLHNIYSEAIQLDASTKDSPWDGGFLASIDPNYEKNNPERRISQNITIRHNHFLPYYKEDGQVVAYGATIGQHSSEVGPVIIKDNVFKETLASRFRDQVPEADRWLLEPIHLYPKEKMTIEGNQMD